MSIGLKRGRVAVEPHRPEWETAAQEMMAAIKRIGKEDILDAQHIGSTSIQGICAKPIVDIVVGVRSFDRMLKHNDALLQEGIVYRGTDHPGQHLYVAGDWKNDIHTHYIHVVLWGQEAWNNYINLRDYLNTHADKAKEYSALKARLAKEHPEDRMAYTNGKSEWLETILRMADTWRKQSV